MPRRTEISNLENIVDDIRSGMLRIEICRKYSIGDKVVDRIARERGLVASKGSRVKVEDKYVEISEAYSLGRSLQSIADEYQISSPTVSRILAKSGTKRRTFSESTRRYSYDDTFFEKIDTPQKAYVFGVFCGDGYNNEKNNLISLRVTDLELVEMVRDAMGCHDKKIIHLKNRGLGAKTAFDLSFANKKMSADLAALGCKQGKSTTLEYPNSVPIELASHFVRGIFDADGSVFSARRTHRLSVSIIATLKFCEKMAEVIPVPSSIRSRKYTRMSDLRISKQRDIILFREWLYADASHSLSRKRDIFYSVEADPRSQSRVAEVNGNKLILKTAFNRGKNRSDGEKAAMSAGHARRSGLFWDDEPIAASVAAERVGRHPKTLRSHAERYGKSMQETIEHYRSLMETEL